MNSKFSKLLPIIFLSATLFSTTSAALFESSTIIEITDRYKEVKLGLTESSIYMVIDERLRSRVNLELQNQYKKDISDFDDSEGNFIPGVHSYLSSNVIEIQFSEINNLEFKNGTLRIDYSGKVPFELEDVISMNGNIALDNFFVEDLERLYQAAISQS